jgi:hypothetical protein
MSHRPMTNTSSLKIAAASQVNTMNSDKLISRSRESRYIDFLIVLYVITFFGVRVRCLPLYQLSKSY